jgi:hypothetical protein
MTTTAVRAIFFGALVAFALGALTTAPVHAQYTYSLEIHPGRYAQLNCGWHNTCLPDANGNYETDGVALDWNNGPYYGYWTVYFRSWGYTNAPAVGRGTIVSDNTTTCYRVRVDISSPAAVVYRGSTYYTHTNTQQSGGTIPIAGSSLGTWTSSGVGYTVADELTTSCPEGGANPAHLHQSAYGESGTWYRQVSGSTSVPYATANIMYTQQYFGRFTNQGYWQNRGLWTY